MSNKTKVKISSFGLKVLKKLNSASGKFINKDAGVRFGSLSVPPSLISELKSLGLVVVCDEGCLGLSPTGRSYLHRITYKPAKVKNNKNMGATVTDPFVSQHQRTEAVSKRRDGKLKKLKVNMAESPLGWLRKRKGRNGQYLISEDQFEAAERLRGDFDLSSQNKQLVANYDGVAISKNMRAAPTTLTYTEFQLDARTRFDKAVAYVGAGLSDSLIRTCCHLEGFEEGEKTLGWPSRSMKLVIVMALNRLVEHYEKGERPTR